MNSLNFGVRTGQSSRFVVCWYGRRKSNQALRPPERDEELSPVTWKVKQYLPVKSSAYICVASPIWRRLLMHDVACPFCFALESAGNNIPARMAMIAMTTSNSIRVKPGGSHCLRRKRANPVRLIIDVFGFN